jgi:hypothetical protein
MQPSSEEHSADQTAMAQSNAKGHSLNRNGSQRYRSDDSSAEPTSQSTVRTRAGGGSARHRPAAARARGLRRRTATRGGALTRAANPATVKSSQRKGHRQRISSTGRSAQSSTQSSTQLYGAARALWSDASTRCRGQCVAQRTMQLRTAPMACESAGHSVPDKASHTAHDGTWIGPVGVSTCST